MGYKVSDNGSIEIENVKKFNNLLKIIAYNIWSKNKFTGEAINSRTLNKISDIKSYFNFISESDAKKVDEEILKNTKFNLFDEAVIEPPIYTKKGKKIYLSLIPPTKGLPKVQSNK